MRKLLAMLLALAMLVSVVPFAALAADDGDDAAIVEETSEPEVAQTSESEPEVEEEPVVEDDFAEEPDDDLVETEDETDNDEILTDDEIDEEEGFAAAFMALDLPVQRGNQDAYRDEDLKLDENGYYKLPLKQGGVSVGDGKITADDASDAVWVGEGTMPDVTDPAADYAYWKLVDTRVQNSQGRYAYYASLTFVDAKGSEHTVRVDANEKHNDKYYVMTPSDWVLTDGFSASDGHDVPSATNNFNCSSAICHKPEVVKVTVTADVNAWHNEITPYEYYERDVDKYYERPIDEYYERSVDEFYERTVDKYYERTVDEYYERTVDEYYERTVDEFYLRPVTEIMQRYAQRYLIPVFEKKMAGEYKGTLVTRLDYSGNTAKAEPTNGGAFNNGHTYVTVDVAKASQGDGVWYTIADSSKNNGKKTPDQYNTPIDYQYNVKIADGKLTVSFGEDLAYASVGAEVWAKAPNKFNNAPKHAANSVTVDVPSNKGTVDLYVHLEKLGWYELDEEGNNVYQFKEWQYDDSRTEYDEEYTKIDTVYGDYELVDTQYGEYQLVKTVEGEYELDHTDYGEYELVDTVEGKYELVGTEYGDYELVKTVEGKYELVGTEYGDYELDHEDIEEKVVTDVYTGELTLTIDGEVAELDQEIKLVPGVHTFVLSGEGFEDVTETVTIAQNRTVTLKAEVQYDDVTLETDKEYEDREATEHYADMATEKHYADEAAEKHYADKEAEEHFADKTAEKHYADKEATKYYNDAEATEHYDDAEATQDCKEEYLYKEDEKLGNEDDPYGEYAVRE